MILLKVANTLISLRTKAVRSAKDATTKNQ